MKMNIFYKVSFIACATLACAQEDVPPVFDYENKCNSDMRVMDHEHPFSAEIDDVRWVPNQKGGASFYKGNLSFGAGDSTFTNGGYKLNLKVVGPVLGLNDLALQENALTLHHHIDRSTVRHGRASCAYLWLEKLDTINGVVSGYFHGSIEHAEQAFHAKISNGSFELELRQLFCKTPFEVHPASVNLFNNWRLIGFIGPDNILDTRQPCDSYGGVFRSSISFQQDGENGKIKGQGPVNYFDLEILVNDSTFITSDLLPTRGLGPNHAMDFEYRYFDLIGDTELFYHIENNMLFLTNKEKEIMLQYELMHE